MTKTEAMDKVRKLLALANSANEHEAANAAARAAQIMERHRLDAAMLADAEQRQIEEDEAYERNQDIPAARAHVRMPPWYWSIAWSVAKANRCMPRSYDSAGSKRRVTFMGRPSDARAAVYMLDAIANEVDRLGREYVSRLDRGAPRSAGKSFRLGAARTISQRLDASARETDTAIRGELRASGDEAGLVRLDRAIALRKSDADRLRAWAKDHGVTYRTGSGGTVSNAGAYQAGAKAGHSVRLRGGAASLGTGARALPSKT